MWVDNAKRTHCCRKVKDDYIVLAATSGCVRIYLAILHYTL